MLTSSLQLMQMEPSGKVLIIYKTDSDFNHQLPALANARLKSIKWVSITKKDHTNVANGS